MPVHVLSSMQLPGSLVQSLTHLFSTHKTFLLLQVDLVYGETLLSPGLIHDGAVRSAHHPAFPASHLHGPPGQKQDVNGTDRQKWGHAKVKSGIWEVNAVQLTAAGTWAGVYPGQTWNNKLLPRGVFALETVFYY